MPSLKETKGRRRSVRSTLKITSAMKMVASAKLHKAQLAIGNMLPYEQRLHRMLVDLMPEPSSSEYSDICAPDPAGVSNFGSGPAADVVSNFGSGSVVGPAPVSGMLLSPREVHRVAIVAFASNSSLCGSFNASVIRQTRSVIGEYRSAGLPDSCITVYSVGRKVADAMRKDGFLNPPFPTVVAPSASHGPADRVHSVSSPDSAGLSGPSDFSKLSESPDYEGASALARELLDGFLSGRFDKIELVYNHYQSTASQPTIRVPYLPLSLSDGSAGLPAGRGPHVRKEEMPHAANPEDYILEPSRETVLKELLPKVIRLRIYATLLDSSAAEHAARTVAMQTATDNGQEILEDLTLAYNKSRQQKITSEILDIVSGSMV